MRKITEIFKMTLDNVFFRNKNVSFNKINILQGLLNYILYSEYITGSKGSSAGYSVKTGWLAAYPETTGYIIPTLFNFAKYFKDDSLSKVALRMADWLLKIQNPNGSFSGGQADKPNKPLIFDTGMIIFGLISAYKKTLDLKYKKSLEAATKWIVKNQEDDGRWVKCTYNNIPHSYHSRVAWALVEAGFLLGNNEFIKSGEKNINWVIKNQTEDGWFQKCGFDLDNYDIPFTHTIAYTLRGILEVGLILNKDDLINITKFSIDKIKSHISQNGFLPGSFKNGWIADNSYTCLTGNCQVSIILKKLYNLFNEESYKTLSINLNNFVSSTIVIKEFDNMKIFMIPGSYPVWGKYLKYFSPNWAVKFYVDAILEEINFEKEFNY